MLDNNLTISLMQFDPRWEDISYNMSCLEEMIYPLADKTDLIVLPEMFSTGFSMNAGYLHSDDHHMPVLLWMKQQAELTGAMITGSVAVMENERCYNRFYWVWPDGQTGYYDKHHLFSMSDEPLYFTAGKEQKQFRLLGWEIKPIICYDLRFPAWCRNNRTNPYDLLICPASWPSIRSDVWLTLLKARALENQCYVVGLNRVGTDGNGLLHKGDSIVFGPKGEIVGRLPENEETVANFDLSLISLQDFRKKFPTLKDMDDISL